MKKVVISGPGSYDRLCLEEQPDPEVGAGDVLIEVEAIGVNFADCMVRMGLYSSAKEYVGWPITPGFEVAGHIARVGTGVQRWNVGQKVLAVTRFGGYSTHLVVPSHQVFPVPESFSLSEAAGFPSVFCTAWYALFELAHPRPGSRILVHSAAGGVGSALLQLSQIADCQSLGVVSGAHKIETAKRYGAHAVVDQTRENLWDAAEEFAPEGFQVVLDANGVATLAQSYRHLSPAGKLIVYGFATMLPRGGGRPSWLKLAWSYLRTPRFNPVWMTSANKSVLAFNLSYLFDRTDILEEAMTQLLGWVQEGKIQAPPVTEFPLEDVAAAHQALESGKTTGKLVLRTSS